MSVKPVSAKICPYCKKALPQEAAVQRYRPFCSDRCKLADLGDWASGRYAVPVVDLDDIAEVHSAEVDDSSDPSESS